MNGISQLHFLNYMYLLHDLVTGLLAATILLKSFHKLCVMYYFIQHIILRPVLESVEKTCFENGYTFRRSKALFRSQQNLANTFAYELPWSNSKARHTVQN